MELSRVRVRRVPRLLSTIISTRTKNSGSAVAR